MLERLAELVCIIVGHRIYRYDSDIYGVVCMCARCGTYYEIPPSATMEATHD